MKEKLFANAIEENVARIRERIENACIKAGRDVSEVTLMGVSKTVEAERVNQAIAAGIHVLGENRVQELLQKKPLLHLDDVSIHLIGHLQTNKVKMIVGEVDLIHSVDSVHLAEAIEKESEKKDLVSHILVEINIGEESSKSGVSFDQTYELIDQISRFPHLKIDGLMCIPPISEDHTVVRQYFSKMHQMFLDIDSKKIDNVSMSILSMGMSSDFEDAIREGSTMVRVGTSLFGGRNYNI